MIHKALWKARRVAISLLRGPSVAVFNRNGWPTPELHLPAAHQRRLM